MTATEYATAADVPTTEPQYPARMCFGCGVVSETNLADRIHAHRCDVATVRPWHCPGCAAENWRRSSCRVCGREPIGGAAVL